MLKPKVSKLPRRASAATIRKHINAKGDYWQKQFSKHYGKQPTDVIGVVLRGHLLVESLLDSFLRSSAWSEEYVASARLSFHQKAKLARAFVLHPQEELWASIDLINSIRNDFSHSLEPPKIEPKIAEIVRLTASLAENPDVIRRARSDASKLMRSISFILGALTALDVLHEIMEGQRDYSAIGSRRKRRATSKLTRDKKAPPLSGRGGKLTEAGVKRVSRRMPSSHSG